MDELQDLTQTEIKGYELVERIGAGGFGAVYKAYQSTIARDVAIKIILPGLANHPDFIRRFEAEAQVIARLEHPYIVPLYDYWRDPEGAYLVMRWLRGGSLRMLLKQKKMLDPDTASAMLDQIADALDLAHRNDVIHRDIKPGNILLDEDGNAYLADFGIAKDLTDNQGEHSEIDAIVGSPDYISPEQARSEPVTQRTDIYSLGVTLYEMLAGEHPFPNLSPVQRLYKHISDPLPEINSLDLSIRAAVNDVIRKATTKDPLHRYDNALMFALEFRKAINVTDYLATQLTQREHQVLRGIAEGLSYKQIASELFITVGTVKSYVKQVYRKLGVRNRVQATVRARELNLVGAGIVSDESGVISISSLPEPDNPYKGLRPFQSADFRDFFGREHLVNKLLDKMKETRHDARFLAIVGPSGSGKSSLMKAGLIPAIWNGNIPGSDRWFVAEMIPGFHPIDELEIALDKVSTKQTANLQEYLWRDVRGLQRASRLILPEDDTELVLFIDQFEEVFTLVEDEAERQQFLDILYGAVTDTRSRVRIVVTLRADFYDRPLHYPDFGELLRNRMETILPLSAQGLEQAIKNPASRVHVTYEEGLVAQIVSEMNYQSGALPLLQYALTELFEQREGRILTHQAYQNIGGAAGALAKRAQSLLDELPLTHQDETRRMFLRLITLGEGAGDTRRRATRSELLSIADNDEIMDEVIDLFTEYRLLALDHDLATRSPTVEVAHEALLTQWDQLRIWVSDSREDIRIQQQLAHTTKEWKRASFDVSYLATGYRLEQLESWFNETALALTELEQEFIKTSIEEHDKRIEIDQTRKDREAILEKRSVQRLRSLVIVFAIAVFVAVVLSIFAISQSLNATQERNTAQQRASELQAFNLYLSAREEMNAGHPETALALAIETMNSADAPPETIDLLRDIAESPGVARQFIGHTGKIQDMEFLRQPSRIMTASGRDITDRTVSDDNSIRLWDVYTGEEIMRFEGHTDSVLDVDVHRISGRMLSASLDSSFILWDINTGEQIQRFEDLEHATRVSFVNDTTALFYSVNLIEGTTTYSASQLILRDLETGDIIHDLSYGDDTIIKDWVGFGITNNTQRVITAHGNFEDGIRDTFVLWNIEDGDILHTFEPFAGQTITNYLLDTPFADTGANISVTPDRKQAVFSTQSYDCNASTNNFYYIWNLQDGSISNRGSTDYYCSTLTIINNDLAIAREHNYQQRESFLVDLDSGEAVTNVANPGFPLLSNGGQMTMVVQERKATLFDALTWNDIFTVDFSLDITSVTDVLIRDNALLDEPSLIFTGHDDGIVRLWTLAPFEQNSESLDVGLSILDVAWSPDGQYILTGSGEFNERLNNRSNRLVLWDAEQREIVREFEGHDNAIWSVAFSPDGQTVVSGSTDNSLIFWDVDTGEMLLRVSELSAAPREMVFSSDGQTLYVALSIPSVDYQDASVAIIDVETGTLLGELTVPVRYSPTGVGGLDISHDDKRLAVAGFEQVTVWELESQEVIATLLFDGSITQWTEGLSFNGDSSQIIVSPQVSGTMIWDLDSDQLIQNYRTETANFYHQLAISPDGSQVAVTIGNWGDDDDIPGDKGVVIWDIESGAELFRLRGHTRWVRGVAYSPDGSQIASASTDGTVRIWNLDNIQDDIMAWLETNRYIPELPCEQRVRYQLTSLCEEE